MSKTIAQQLNIKDFPFIIKDKNENQIYSEDSNGYWSKSEYDSKGQEIYWESSVGYWVKKEYDSNGQEIYWESSEGYRVKREYDENGKVTYWESSKGEIIDNRTKKVVLTMDDIASKFGIPVSELKIKK